MRKCKWFQETDVSHNATLSSCGSSHMKVVRSTAMWLTWAQHLKTHKAPSLPPLIPSAEGATYSIWFLSWDNWSPGSQQPLSSRQLLLCSFTKRNCSALGYAIPGEAAARSLKLWAGKESLRKVVAKEVISAWLLHEKHLLESKCCWNSWSLRCEGEMTGSEKN